MAITLDETIIPLTAVPDKLPRRRQGKLTHKTCVYRWSTIGCRGVVLETAQVGGTRCTSVEALQRFIDALSKPVRDRRSVPAPVAPLQPKRRRKELELIELEAQKIWPEC